MAYTGTGTQDDPYLVSTFADFRTCIKEAGAYVKLTADIDVFAEGYTSATYSLNISAAKVYSDNGYTISNLNVYDGGIFNAENATKDTGCVIENINFDDIIFKNSTPGCILSRTGTNRLTFRKCRIRVSCTYNNWVIYVFKSMLVEDCSIYIEFSGEYHGANQLDYSSSIGTVLRRTTVEIVNLNTGQMLWNTNRLIENFICEYCTLKLDLFPWESYTGTVERGALLMSTGSHDNIVIVTVNGNHIKASVTTFTVHTNGLTAVDTTNSVFSRDDSTAPIKWTAANGAVLPMTYEQITSEEYLRNAGFIP